MKNQAGSQLIELLIACLILFQMGGLAIVNFRDGLEQYRLQWAGQMLAHDLSLARSLALTLQLPVSVVVRPDGGAYGFVEKGQSPLDYRQLPRGLLITKCPKRFVTFYSRGSAVPSGSFVLSNRAGNLKVVVSGAGRVRWEYVEQQ